mmetsp:Transcript_113724/g.361382  ORF Transcript_113724/g.361382 Transcript_113724/m.361382 type:complete len:273 (+) Transcript_113724:1466-2284(+)
MRRGFREPARLLLLQPRHDLLVALQLLRTLLLQLYAEVLKTHHLLFQTPVLTRVRVEVSIPLHLLLCHLGGLEFVLNVDIGLVVALGGREDILQGKAPEGDVERHRQAFVLEGLRQKHPDYALQLQHGLGLLDCGRRIRGLAVLDRGGGLGHGAAVGRQPVPHREESQVGLEHREDLLSGRHQRGILVARACLRKELRQMQKALVVAIEKQTQEFQAAAATVALGEFLREEVVPLPTQGVPEHWHEALVHQRAQQRHPRLVLTRVVLLLPPV